LFILLLLIDVSTHQRHSVIIKETNTALNSCEKPAFLLQTIL